MTREELAAIRARVEAVKHYAEIALADALTRYEDAAERFHRETGLMAPGKSEPMAWGGSEAHDAERRSRWEAWLMGDMRRRSTVEVELADDVARLTAEVERLSAMVPRWVNVGTDRAVWRLRVAGQDVVIVQLESKPNGRWYEWPTSVVHPDLPTACAAVCRRLGLTDIKPPTENT